MHSNFLNLNARDVTKGLVVAVLAAALAAFQQMLNEHGLDFALYDWTQILNISVSAGVAYLGKNLFSDSKDKVLGAL